MKINKRNGENRLQQDNVDEIEQLNKKRDFLNKINGAERVVAIGQKCKYLNFLFDMATKIIVTYINDQEFA